MINLNCSYNNFKKVQSIKTCYLRILHTDLDNYEGIAGYIPDLDFYLKYEF